MIFESLLHAGRAASERVSVRSALNPILWLSAIYTPMAIGAAIIFKDDRTVRNLLLLSSVVPEVVACAAYVGFAIFSPQRLQSEDYQLRHESLQIIQQKGSHLRLDAASLEAIANPATTQIKDKETL